MIIPPPNHRFHWPDPQNLRESPGRGCLFFALSPRKISSNTSKEVIILTIILWSRGLPIHKVILPSPSSLSLSPPKKTWLTQQAIKQHFHILQSNDSVINFHDDDLERFLKTPGRSKNYLYPTGYAHALGGRDRLSVQTWQSHLLAM